MRVYLTPHPTAIIVTVVVGELFEQHEEPECASFRVLLPEEQAQAFMKHIHTYPTLYEKATFATHDIYIRDLVIPEPKIQRRPRCRPSCSSTVF